VTENTSTWFAPGRANIMGEHTDYNGGLVLPFALAQGVSATVTARADDLLVMRSKQMTSGDPVTASIAALRPGSVPGWAAYPAGVAWALAQAGYPVSGADIDIDSDLPVGAGVSSSAALECSVALALADLGGHAIERRELARIARQAENDFVGAPTGIIDQSASLLCQAGHAMLLDCLTGDIRQVPFSPARDGMAALVIDTHVPHALADGQYAARRAECEEAARTLGVSFLGSTTSRSASPAALSSVLAGLASPVLARRARHVLTDSARARTIGELLSSGGATPRNGRLQRGSPGFQGCPLDSTALATLPPSSVAPLSPGEPRAPFYNRDGDSEEPFSAGDRGDLYWRVGELLTEGHASLRDDFEVSWPEADVTVETAVAAGALGAKMIGGGFGGSVLALVPVAALAAVRVAVRAEFGRRGWESPEFLEAVPSPAARKISL
jgi:galactokinase